MGKICGIFLLLLLIRADCLAIEVGALPLLPGERYSEPRQGGLDEVMEIPTIDLACPTCGHGLSVPAVDTLMRRPPYSDEPAPKWRMHALYRDSDLCPYPQPGKIAYQADIVVCPLCGFTERLDLFATPVPAEATLWVNRNVTPEFQATLRHLLGQRATEMTDAEILAFFSAQDVIPDTLRTELYRAYLAATHAPGLDRARAALQAAWATRRVVVSRPDGAFLRKHTAAVTTELGKNSGPKRRCRTGSTPFRENSAVSGRPATTCRTPPTSPPAPSSPATWTVRDSSMRRKVFFRKCTRRRANAFSGPSRTRCGARPRPGPARPTA
ncbi:MAG: hypothetical protein LIQ31_03705 [Planctomycetes bacterium]|nr:hypothetical protein [Planctomycetota bacterium]